MINGIFAADTQRGEYHALVFNYNKNDTAYREDELVSVLFQIDSAERASPAYEYRIATYGKEHCSFQRLKADFPQLMTPVSEGGLVKDGFDLHGSFNVILTDEGKELLDQHVHKYVEFNDLKWSGWQKAPAQSLHEGEQALLRIQTHLPSFAFQKIELRRVN